MSNGVTTFVLWAKAAYLQCGTIALMSEYAVLRNDLPVGFLRYLTSAEAWAAGLPVAEAVAEHGNASQAAAPGGLGAQSLVGADS